VYQAAPFSLRRVAGSALQSRMGQISDQLVVRAVRFLKERPAAFRFVKARLQNTIVHDLVRSAKRNVETPLQPVSKTDSNEPTRHWDRNVGKVESKELKGWLDWEFIETEHIRPQLSGDPNVYYLQHFFRRHLPSMPVDRALSLGCGGGNLERALIQLGSARRIDAYDASPVSIHMARELAAKEGLQDRIQYEIADINRLVLPEKTYDYVVCKMSLHHFEALEHIYAQIGRSLKPGGVFMFNEFVGPTRFQWTDRQLALVNGLLRALPERHRRSVLSGDELTEISRPTIDEMIKIDPTEAIRSADIIPVLATQFEILERRDYGGTLLQLLLNHVMATFDLDDEEQASLLRTIFLYERTLLEQNVIASDFSYVVARPRVA
jgi:SAM-dependent methyltransferase